MSFQKYPPDIKGNTISNLILVDNYEYDEKRKGFYDDRNSFGFVEPFNHRDIFLNVNGYETFREVITTINHESHHNILAKHISEDSSEQLDNLFYKVPVRKRLKKILFGLRELSGKESNKIRKRKKHGKKYGSLDVDFWLMRYSK